MGETNSPNITFRVPAEVKEQAERLFEDLGLNMSTALNIFLRKAIEENGIPFDIKRSGFYNAHKAQLIDETVEDYRSGKIDSTEYIIKITKLTGEMHKL